MPSPPLYSDVSTLIIRGVTHLGSQGVLLVLASRISMLSLLCCVGQSWALAWRDGLKPTNTSSFLTDAESSDVLNVVEKARGVSRPMFSGDDPALDQGDNAEDGVPPPPPPLSEYPPTKRQKTAGKLLEGFDFGDLHDPERRLSSVSQMLQQMRCVWPWKGWSLTSAIPGSSRRRLLC